MKRHLLLALSTAAGLLISVPGQTDCNFVNTTWGTWPGCAGMSPAEMCPGGGYAPFQCTDYPGGPWGCGTIKGAIQDDGGMNTCMGSICECVPR
jgi:hypothetical protein